MSDQQRDAFAEPGAVLRRAPFSDNPEVGARGQRTQARILDAALQVFGEGGYHSGSVDQIAKLAGCSRVSFYQYFSSKEDVFQHLTGQVARQLSVSAEALSPLTPDQAGWDAIREWVARHGEIYGRYESVFHAFQAASESDAAVATGSARWREGLLAKVRARLQTSTLPPRQLDPVLGLLLSGLTRAQDVTHILRSAAPDAYDDDRVNDALADVIHRSLFGLDEAVNVHPPAPTRPRVLRFDPQVRAAFADAVSPPELTEAGQRTYAALLASGREVFLQRG